MNKLRYLALMLPLVLLVACDNSSSDGGGSDSFAISTGNLPQAFEGVNFNAQLNTAHGTAPVTFDWVTGFTPPAWLNLSASGLLSGTPTATGTVALEIEATDAASRVATRTLNLNIATPAEITTTDLPRAIKGTAYTATVDHNGTGAITYTFGLSANSAALPNGITFSQGGNFSGTTTDGGLFVLEIELRNGTTVVDTVTLDLVIYESIPYTYVEDANETPTPNDTTGDGTQLLPGATPAGRITAGADIIQATPLTLNSDQNIAKPDPDDFFKFNIGTPGTITIDVYYRALVGEIEVYLWKYQGPPAHAVEVVASSTGHGTDDARIVYHNAQLSGTFSTGYYYLQVHAPFDAAQSLWNRNAYSFRITFSDLAIETEHLEADSATGPIDEQVVAWNQGASLSNPTFSIVSGILPNGVNFTADGRFTGTPTEFGLREYTVRVEENGQSIERDIKVRFFDSIAGDYWQVRGDRELYSAGNSTPFETWGDAMVVAPHPDYPTEGAVYVLGGFSNQMLDTVRVFHTDRAGIPADKHFKFEDIGVDLPNSVRYHRAAFVQHSYGGYIYCVGGEIGAAQGAHTTGDLWRGVFRLQVADGGGNALSHPLSTAWETLAELPATHSSGRDILGWGEFGLAVKDDASDANDRIYLVAGRYDLEDTVASATYSRTFHDHVLMFECPTTGAGTGTWFWKTDTAPYTPRRFPAVAMINDRIYIAAGREGAAGQTGSGGSITGYIEMYEPDNFQANPALSTLGSGSFPALPGGGGYYPMYAQINGDLYIWCGWDANFQGTKYLNRFTPNGAGTGGTVTALMDADWGSGFGGGVAHDGKLWLISGIGHGAHDEPKNLVYIP
jgi:hypothetical protein